MLVSDRVSHPAIGPPSSWVRSIERVPPEVVLVPKYPVIPEVSLVFCWQVSVSGGPKYLPMKVFGCL